MERTAREAAILNEVDEAIARAGTDALKVKTARDMDPILASLGKLRERFYKYNGNPSEDRQRASNRLQTALAPLRGWQDYPCRHGSQPA